MWFVLTYEYLDKSGFEVCGITDSQLVAEAWIAGNKAGEAKAYHIPPNTDIGMGRQPWEP